MERLLFCADLHGNLDQLEVLLILGNDDFRSNREFVVAQQRAGIQFRLIDREPFDTEDGFVLVGYSNEHCQLQRQQTGW